MRIDEDEDRQENGRTILRTVAPRRCTEHVQIVLTLKDDNDDDDNDDDDDNADVLSNTERYEATPIVRYRNVR